MTKTFLMATMAAVGLALTAPALADDAKPLAGQEVTVLLPPWGTLPKDMTRAFTEETGVTLQSQTMGWDDIRTKVITSMIANTAPADATEVDWSWVGQFGAGQWYEPLDGRIDPALVEDIPTTKIFRYDGKLLAVPYSNDFRILIYNKDHLAKAGIDAPPKTPDALLADARAVKKAGIVDHPIGLPLSATEGTATAWYLLTKAFGGELFDNDFKPLFVAPDSAGYKAMTFEVEALKEGLIDPAATGLKDVEIHELFKSGQVTFDVAGWAGNLAVYTDPEKSQVSEAAAAALMPSVTGTSRTFGLPEAVGIPVSAKNKDAAAAFIQWLARPETEIAGYEMLGNLPPRLSVLKDLNAQGKLKDGDVLLQQATLVEPLFAQGTPGWYPEFSSAVATALNQAAKGQITVDQAVRQIADEATTAMRR